MRLYYSPSARMKASWLAGFAQHATLVLVSMLLVCAFAVSAAQAQGRQMKLLRDAETEAMLRDFGDPILEAAGLNPTAVNFYIVDDNSLNAFVAGGQNIFFHTGLLAAVSTPGELKGVIAHETGHISGGHLARSREAMSNATVPMVVSTLWTYLILFDLKLYFQRQLLVPRHFHQLHYY